MGSVNLLGVHECVLGGLYTKIQSRKSASFNPPIWAVIQLNRTTLRSNMFMLRVD